MSQIDMPACNCACGCRILTVNGSCDLCSRGEHEHLHRQAESAWKRWRPAVGATIPWRSLIGKPEWVRVLPAKTLSLLDTLEELFPAERCEIAPGQVNRYVTMGRWLSSARWTGLLTSRELADTKVILARVM